MHAIVRSIRLTLLLGLTTLSGCFGLSRGAPAPEHYVLGTGWNRADVVPAGESASTAVALRQLDLASYLETPFIIVRHGAYRVSFSEFHRWSESLSQGINRTVAGNMAARAPFRTVDAAPWAVGAEHDYVIQLHVLRFEGVAPEDSLIAEGEAHLLANWEIVRRADGSELARGTTEYRGAGWKVGDYGDLVRLLDTGLGALAEDLVGRLVKTAAVQGPE